MFRHFLYSLADASEKRKAAFTAVKDELIAAIKHGIEDDDMALYSAMQDLINANVHFDLISEIVMDHMTMMTGKLKATLDDEQATLNGLITSLTVLKAEKAGLNANSAGHSAAAPAPPGQDVADVQPPEEAAEHNQNLDDID